MNDEQMTAEQWRLQEERIDQEQLAHDEAFDRFREEDFVAESEPAARWFVGEYVNTGDCQSAPLLVKQIQSGLTVQAAEKLTTEKNKEAGHFVDGVELRLLKTTARYYMYDFDADGDG